MIDSSRSSTLRSSSSKKSDGGHWSPWQQDMPLSPSHRFMDVPGIRINEFSPLSSSSSSSLLNKRFTSEANIARKSKSASGESPLVAITNTTSPQRTFRKTLASCSNDAEIRDSSSSLRVSNSCNDLNQISNGMIGGGGGGVRKGISHSVPTTPYDSEDCQSYYSSVSDLSRNNSVSSDSDPTPRSSSVSPDNHDSAFILSPTHSSSVRVITSPESSPARRKKSPALSTLASNLIEVSRGGGGGGEYRGPSPEGLGGQKKFQNTQGGGCTLEHPLVNGLKSRDSDEEKQINNNEVSVILYTLGGILLHCLACSCV